MSVALTEPAKLLLLTALLANDRIVSKNGISFIKELILRRDTRLTPLLKAFESKDTKDNNFVEQIHDLIMEESQIVYDELFEDTSLEVGKTLSKDEREKKQLNAEKSLIYGEVEYNSFYRVLRKINPQAGLIFYDLGSGTGKAVFAARMTQDFSKCIGIEILEGLHSEAESIVKKYNEDFKGILYHGQSNYANVFEGSFLDFDWSDGDVVFANSTCFDDELMLGLSKAAEKLKAGAIVVTFTKGMTSRKFEVLEKKRYKMSWGPATVFIHRRLNANGSPVGPAKLNLLPSDQDDYDDEANSQSPSKQSQVYKGASSDYRNVKGSDEEDDEEEDDEEEEEDFENDGIDEGDEDEDDEDDADAERHYKLFNHAEGKYNEEEEEEDDDDLDIDEYIRNISNREMRNNKDVSAANTAYAQASAVHTSFSPKDRHQNQNQNQQHSPYHESSPSRDKAYDEEESATEGSDSAGSDGSNSSEDEEEDDADDEEGDSDGEEENFRDVNSPEQDDEEDEDEEEEEDEEDEDANDDEEEVNEEVRHEMEEQIRLISARIAHNKTLIHTYTDMAAQYTHKDPSYSPGRATEEDEEEDEDEEDEEDQSGDDDEDHSTSTNSSGSELQPVHSSQPPTPPPRASPYRAPASASPASRLAANYPPTPPSASALRSAAAASSSSSSNGPSSGTKSASHSASKPSPGNPYASPVRSVNGGSSAPGSYSSPTKATSSASPQKDPSPYANAPPQLSASGLGSSQSGKKLFMASSPSQRSVGSAEDFAQMTSPQDSALQARKRMGQIAARNLNPTDSD